MRKSEFLPFGGFQCFRAQERQEHLDQEEYDTERTAFLESNGYRVLRFWNTDVMNKINDVMGAIMEELGM
ncbi:MAG TPA: DUF559 domain-containing protein [Anaerolineales bacterium]